MVVTDSIFAHNPAKIDLKFCNKEIEMKRKYVDEMADKIAELKQEIDKYLNRPGEGKMKEILHHQFALSEKDTREFIRIIEDMICGASFEDLPEDWFFEKRFPRREKTSKGKIIRNGRSKKPFRKPMYRFKSRKEESLEIRREHEEVKNKIKQFWKLSDNVKNRVLERWPEEYCDFLLKTKIIDDGDEIHEKFSAAYIANIILSKRWDLSTKTIETYIKPHKNLLFPRS